MYSSISNGAQNYQYEESQPNRSSSISEDVVAAFDMMNLSGAPAASSNVVAQGHSSHSGPPFSASSSVGHTPRHDSDTVLNAPSLYENEEYANAPSFPYSGRGMPSGAPPPLPLGSEHNGVDSVTRDNSSSLDRGPGFALDAHSADFGEYDLLSASNHTGKGNN